MFATLLAAALLAPTGPALSCAVMLDHAAKVDGPSTEYAGLRVSYCCPGCKGKFEAKPAEHLKKAAEAKKVIATSLFDPVTGRRLEKDGIEGTFDYQGVRWQFSSTDSLDAFKKEPKTYAKLPEKEALFCPVMKSEIASPSEAVAYEDYEGVRYYICCGGCVGKFAGDPAKFAPNAASYVKPTGAHQEPS